LRAASAPPPNNLILILGNIDPINQIRLTGKSGKRSSLFYPDFPFKPAKRCHIKSIVDRSFAWN
jgi:hypothetical protein